MNIYLRYFDSEVLVDSVEKALDFLRSIQEIKVDAFLEKELRQYAEGTLPYPKRFKVSSRSYFIVIKTDAQTMEQFKAAGMAARDGAAERAAQDENVQRLNEVNPGWYEASLLFRRVVALPELQKFQYVDTTFSAKVKADSMSHCYDRMIAHLQSRPDVDNRSQFPSIKGRNFECQFLGND